MSFRWAPPPTLPLPFERSTGTNHYNGEWIDGQGPAPGTFISALLDYPFVEDTTLRSFVWDGLCDFAQHVTSMEHSCNTPAGLHTKVGWDNVTGVGTPNGKAFADSFKPEAALK